jgi:transposase
MAERTCGRLRCLVARVAAVIRIDALWLATVPIDMRMGTERLLARVVQVFGSAQAHHGYLFANARGNRIKLLLHDGFGMWCAAMPTAGLVAHTTVSRFVDHIPYYRQEQINARSGVDLNHQILR